MPDDKPLTIETMRVLAQQAGLALSDEQLQEIMPGVARNRERAKTLEKFLGVGVSRRVGRFLRAFRRCEGPLRGHHSNGMTDGAV